MIESGEFEVIGVPYLEKHLLIGELAQKLVWDEDVDLWCFHIHNA